VKARLVTLVRLYSKASNLGYFGEGVSLRLFIHTLVTLNNSQTILCTFQPIDHSDFNNAEVMVTVVDIECDFVRVATRPSCFQRASSSSRSHRLMKNSS